MKIDSATARWFSESLLRLYSCTSEQGATQSISDSLAQLEARPKARGRARGKVEMLATEWFRVALHDAARGLRDRLAARSSGSDPAASGLQVLTRREREVVHRISLGDTDAEIGRALGISPKTASKHVENILRKLGVETRTAAAAVLLTAAIPGQNASVPSRNDHPK